MKINIIKEFGHCEECGLSHAHKWNKDEVIYEIEFGIEHIKTLQLCKDCLEKLQSLQQEEL